MKSLPIEHLGTEVQAVRLNGDPRRPEPLHFRVVFPFGDIDISRCDDGSYWVHVNVWTPEQQHSDPSEIAFGEFIDGRVDCHGKHASETIDLAAPLNAPGVYHLAVRIRKTP